MDVKERRMEGSKRRNRRGRYTNEKGGVEKVEENIPQDVHPGTRLRANSSKQ